MCNFILLRFIASDLSDTGNIVLFENISATNHNKKAK